MRTLPPPPVSISVWGGSWLHLNKHIRHFLHEIFQQVFLETPGLWLELETDPDYHERWGMSLSSPGGESEHKRLRGMNERFSVSSPVTILLRAVWPVNLVNSNSLSRPRLATLRTDQSGSRISGLTNQGPEPSHVGTVDTSNLVSHLAIPTVQRYQSDTGVWSEY